MGDSIKAKLKINRREAEEFLRFLDSEAKEFTFQTFDDNRKRADPKLNRVLHGSLDERFDQLCDLNNRGASVCVMINAGDGDGRKTSNVSSVRAVFADLDGVPLDPVLDCELQPHLIVKTSPNRYHAYWFAKDLPRQLFTPLQLAIVDRFGSDDRVRDLPHVMRLPGFFHRKTRPFRVQIWRQS